MLGRASAALERGRGAEVTQLLAPLLRSDTLSREDALSVRTALAEGWLLQDDLTQATAALGRTPDSMHEPMADVRLSMLWRLHGRIAFARGDQPREYRNTAYRPPAGTGNFARRSPSSRTVRPP